MSRAEIKPFVVDSSSAANGLEPTAYTSYTSSNSAQAVSTDNRDVTVEECCEFVQSDFTRHETLSIQSQNSRFV